MNTLSGELRLICPDNESAWRVDDYFADLRLPFYFPPYQNARFQRCSCSFIANSSDIGGWPLTATLASAWLMLRMPGITVETASG